MEQEVLLPSSQTTLVILLGAKEWPDAPEFSASKAFADTASALSEYFLDSRGFKLPKENFLNLFDADKSSDDIDREIGIFLTKRVSEMKEAGHPARDLLVYFVGHGGFAGNDFDYYLAIRRTREDNPSASSIRMVTLAYTIKEKARHLRRIIILDCCFAASASKFFQTSEPAQAAVKQTIDAFGTQGKGDGIPGRGTSLLCSSRHNIPSLISPDGSCTMFSQALLHALRTGDSSQKSLSLRTIALLAKGFLHNTYNDKAPNPEVHSPDQSEGDVADVPFFPTLTQKIAIPVPVIAVMGAKGGVGKGTFITCAAQMIADSGHDVAVIDFDLEARGSTLNAVAEYGTESLPVKSVFEHLAPHSKGFEQHSGFTNRRLWDITPNYLRKRERGRILLLPACESTALEFGFDIVANIPDTPEKPREDKLVELTKEMLARVREQRPTIRCIFIDCGAALNCPLYTAAFACADYRYIITLPDARYFETVGLIQKVYRQHYTREEQQEIFVVINRVTSEADKKRCQRLHPWGYIPLDPLLERESFSSGVTNYILGFDDVFASVYACLHKELNTEEVHLLPGEDVVRFKPLQNHFIKDKLAERILHSTTFRRQAFFFWSLTGLMVCILGIAAWGTSLEWGILPILFTVLIILAWSIWKLLSHEKKRRALKVFTRMPDYDDSSFYEYDYWLHRYPIYEHEVSRWLRQLLNEERKKVYDSLYKPFSEDTNWLS